MGKADYRQSDQRRIVDQLTFQADDGAWQPALLTGEPVQRLVEGGLNGHKDCLTADGNWGGTSP